MLRPSVLIALSLFTFGPARAWGEDEPREDAEQADPERPEPDDEASGGAGPAGAGTPIRDRRGIDAMGVPLVGYNSDLGWGIGLVGGGYFYSPGYDPYRHALAAQFYITTEGVRNHWVRYDGPSLVGDLRIEARGEYRRELFAPYYGAGNLAGDGADVRTDLRRWTFDHYYPGAWLRARAEPLGSSAPLGVYGGYAFHWVKVTPFGESALWYERPRGMEGGAHGQLLFGALWDTRDNEADPTSGGVEEISMRLSATPTGSRYTYAGITFTEKRFWSLGTPRVVFAQRLILDVLTDGAPFFEWSQIGGVHGAEGIGGMSSVRGVPRNRFVGTVKAVSNSELRFYVWDFPLFGQQVKTGGVVYFDAGRVWHPGVDDGPFFRWHPGVGAGLRLARRAAVARVDVAFSTETWREGIYVTFGHMF